MKVRVALETMSDILNFVAITSMIGVPVYLTHNDFRVCAKSLLGARYTMEWDEVWCECDRDIYSKIEHFVIIE